MALIAEVLRRLWLCGTCIRGGGIVVYRFRSTELVPLTPYAIFQGFSAILVKSPQAQTPTDPSTSHAPKGIHPGLRVEIG